MPKKYDPLRDGPPPVAGAKKSRRQKTGSNSKITDPNAAPQLRPYHWKPGQSGNPKGRPKSSTEMKQRAASLTDVAMDILEMQAMLAMRRLQWASDVLSAAKEHPQDVVEAALKLAGDKDLTGAAQAILDRGHGKATQKVENSNADMFDEMTREEFEDFLVTAGKKVIGRLADRKKLLRPD
jgi:hypothetical protein